jgi:signal transduction histidine kinase
VGWLVAGGLALVVVRLRLRLELVARAEHELRGPLTAFSLALDAARGTPAGRRLAVVLDAELARARAGLADLAAARRGRRAIGAREPVRVDRLLRSSGAAWDQVARAGGAGRRVRVRWTAGLAVAQGDRARLAQAFGNVMSNAVEHGAGDVSVSASRPAPDRVRIEVTNDCASDARAGEGRGLVIAADAAASSGGRLMTAVGPHRATAVLDLPVEP